jgi:hypothetical protein
LHRLCHDTAGWGCPWFWVHTLRSCSSSLHLLLTMTLNPAPCCCCCCDPPSASPLAPSQMQRLPANYAPRMNFIYLNVSDTSSRLDWYNENATQPVYPPGGPPGRHCTFRVWLASKLSISRWTRRPLRRSAHIMASLPDDSNVCRLHATPTHTHPHPACRHLRRPASVPPGPLANS